MYDFNYDHEFDGLPDDAILYADSNRGVFIPQHFAETINRDAVTGVSDEVWQILDNGPEPDNEWYWDAWIETENNAVVTDTDNGVSFKLHHDGDLWLVPVAAEE